MKAYLGDAVYAQLLNDRLDLTTEDGVCATNRIILEPQVWRALSRFMEHAEGGREACWRRLLESTIEDYESALAGEGPKQSTETLELRTKLGLGKA